MRESKGRLRRVGNDRGRDVTNEAARLVWEVVRAEGGKIWWEEEDGTCLVLKAETIKQMRKKTHENTYFIDNHRRHSTVRVRRQQHATGVRDADVTPGTSPAGDIHGRYCANGHNGQQSCMPAGKIRKPS